MHQEATVEYSVPYHDSSRAPPPQPPYNGIEASPLLYRPYLQGVSYPWGFFTVKTQPSSVVASSYTQQVRLLANWQAVSYFPDLCVPVNGHFHGPKADLSWCVELEWQVYSAHNEICTKSRPILSLRPAKLTLRTRSKYPQRRVVVATSESRLIPIRGTFHRILQQLCIMEGIRRDRTIGRLNVYVIEDLGSHFYVKSRDEQSNAYMDHNISLLR